MSERESYTLSEFQTKYALPEDEAARLFSTFGPDKMNLDILMRGKLDRAALRTPLSRHAPQAASLPR